MVVRNEYHDYQLNRLHRHLNQQYNRQIRKIKLETNKVEYDYKALKIETTQYEREQKRRENPHFDTTYEDIFLQKSSKYLTYNPEDSNYLKKKNVYPFRTPVNQEYISPSVKQARHLLMEQDVRRSVQSARERRQAKKESIPEIERPKSTDNSISDSTIMRHRNMLPAKTEAGSRLAPKPTSFLVSVEKTRKTSISTVVLQRPVESNECEGNKCRPSGAWNGSSGRDGITGLAGESSRTIPNGKTVSNQRHVVEDGHERTTLRELVPIHNNKSNNSSTDYYKTRSKERNIMACFENIKNTIADETGRITTKYIQLPIIAKLKSPRDAEDTSETESCKKENTAVDDYDVEERLIELGIIKEKKVEVKRMPARPVPNQQPATRTKTREIKNKIDHFFFRLEVEKERERLKAQALATEKEKAKKKADAEQVTTKPCSSNQTMAAGAKWKKASRQVMNILAFQDGRVDGSKIMTMTGKTRSTRKKPTAGIRHGWRSPSPPPNWVVPRISLNSQTDGAGQAPTGRKKKVGIPGASAERSKRHTPTFKLNKMVQALVAKKTKFELMKIEKAKQVVIEAETGKPLELNTETDEHKES